MIPKARSSRTFFQVLLLLAAAVSVASCGSFNKLMKSQDNELKYKKGMEYYAAKKYQKARQLLEDVSPIFTGTSKEDTIQFHIAAANYNLGDFESSGPQFNEFRRRFGRSPFVEQAEYMYAMGFYYSSPAPERDQMITRQALMAISEYLQHYPNSVKKEELSKCMEELQQKLYDKVFLNAKTYYDIKKYKSAVVALKNALNTFPDTNHREELMFLIVKSNYLLASNSLPALQKDRYLDMLDTYYNFASEFPQSKYTKESDKMQEAAKKYLAAHETDENKDQNNGE